MALAKEKKGHNVIVVKLGTGYVIGSTLKLDEKVLSRALSLDIYEAFDESKPSSKHSDLLKENKRVLSEQKAKNIEAIKAYNKKFPTNTIEVPKVSLEA